MPEGGHDGAWYCGRRPQFDEDGMRNFCPPEGCPKGYCALDDGWKNGDATPDRCLGIQPATPAELPALPSREEIARLVHVIDRDRYVAAACLGAIEKVLEGRSHLAEPGRGCYEWDDERYQQEFGLALGEIQEALHPLRRLARDKSDCTTDPEKVKAARAAGAEKFAALHPPASVAEVERLREDFEALNRDYGRAALLINVMRERWSAVSDQLDYIGGMHAGLEDAASAMASACDDPKGTISAALSTTMPDGEGE